jgi:formylglycine-generating enzyme required for sulfatase activity
VLRGGSWLSDPWCCRTARRGGDSPAYRIVDGGFRVAVAAGVD